MSDQTGTDFVNGFDYAKLKDRKYKGEDYQADKKIRDGPLQERRCTDCLFLLVFIAFLGLMIWMTL